MEVGAGSLAGHRIHHMPAEAVGGSIPAHLVEDLQKSNDVPRRIRSARERSTGQKRRTLGRIILALLLGIALLLSAAVVIFVHDDGVEVKLVVTDDGAEDGENLKGVQCTNASGPPYKPPCRHAAARGGAAPHSLGATHRTQGTKAFR